MLCFGVARLLGSVAAGYAAEVDLAWAFVLGALLSAIAVAWLWLRFHDSAADTALRDPP
jgi:predicted MFS family arabinose efflux permease